MTRYSASRGILYSAPPGPDSADETATESTTAAADSDDADGDVTDAATADD